MIALNSAVAEQLMKFKKDVDALIEKGEPKVSAILEVIRGYIKECKGYPLRRQRIQRRMESRSRPSRSGL